MSTKYFTQYVETSIENRLKAIEDFIEEILMAAIDTLNANIATLNTTIAAVEAEVTTLKAATGTPEVQVQAAADAVAAANTKLATVLPSATLATPAA